MGHLVQDPGSHPVRPVSLLARKEAPYNWNLWGNASTQQIEALVSDETRIVAIEAVAPACLVSRVGSCLWEAPRPGLLLWKWIQG